MEFGDVLSITDGTVVLWLAVALAVLVLAVFVLDQVTRRGRRHRRGRRGLGARLGKSFSRMRALRGEFKQLVHERSRRERGRGRRPPTTLR